MELVERADQLQRHLISVQWVETGGSLADATKAVRAVDWAECGGFGLSVERFFNSSEQAHLTALAEEEVALVKPWLACDEVRAEAFNVVERLTSAEKRTLLVVPCSSEYLSAPSH